MPQKTAKNASSSTKPKARTGNDALGLGDIKELFSLMKENEIAELNLEQQGTKIHILSTHAPVTAAQPVMQMMPGLSPVVPVSPPAPAPVAPPPPAAPSGPPGSTPPPAEDALPANVKPINSPMVGTFYRSPAPDAPPFVNVGDRVKEDTTLCIVEAMKLMNELKAEIRGRIFKILAENGQPVEYGQPLFLVETE